jgi:hypothetical protein
MSNRARLVYQGPLGRIFCEGASFFASQNGSPVVTCKTFDEAMKLLRCLQERAELKHTKHRL